MPALLPLLLLEERAGERRPFTLLPLFLCENLGSKTKAPGKILHLTRILMLASERKSQRDSAIKPRVASSELPWETSGITPLNLKEVAPTPRMINPTRRDCGMALFLLTAQLLRS